MAERIRYESPIIKLAVERKIISREQFELCRDLVRKSKKIGLESTVEEILIKQGMLTKDQLEELSEISRLGEGGDVFGGYRLGTIIGQGGMGKVYEATHEFTNRSVALKILNSSFTGDENNVARFFQEIRALAKLNHPNIVTLYDAGKSGRRYFFAMERVPGPSLGQHIAKKKLLREKDGLVICRAVAEALDYAHARSIVHRDIKPENIILDESGVPKVTDFGVVMHRDEDHLTLTQEGFMVGSVHYSSPEQVDGTRDIDGRSDIYSLGATLYFMLTGRTVYSGSTAQEILTKHVVGTWVSPRKFNPTVSFRTVRFIRKMMAKNRDKRFQTMGEVIGEINKILQPRHTLRTGLIVAGSSIILFISMLIEAVFHIVENLIYG